jgi:hypothetical protein
MGGSPSTNSPLLAAGLCPAARRMALGGVANVWYLKARHRSLGTEPSARSLVPAAGSRLTPQPAYTMLRAFAQRWNERP